MSDFIKFYKTVMGEWFVVREVDGVEELYYGVGRNEFWEMDRLGFSSSNGVVTNYSVENPHKQFNWIGDFKFNGEIFVLERADSEHCPVFRPTAEPENYRLFPLPYILELKGVYRMPDGKFLFWTGAKYDFDRKDIKFYFGEIDDIREYEVLKYNGSILVTSIGNLSVHGVSFDGYRLNTLERKQFAVEFDGEKIRLVTKK